MASETLDRIKKAFKKLSGEEEPEQETTVPSSTPLITALRELDAAYREKNTNVDLSDPEESYPETLGLVPKTYKEKTEEEMLAEARDVAENKNERTKNRAQEAYAKATEEYGEDIAELELKEEAERKNLEDGTERALKKHRDDMIFRGLVNSTMNVYGSALIEAEYNEETERIRKEYDAKYAKITSELVDAEQKYKNALREYDLSYATDLRNAMDKLKEKEQKRIAEINEYNANISAKEAQYAKKRYAELKNLRKQRASDLMREIRAEARDEQENGVTPEKQAEYDKRLEVARSFYAGYPKAEANLMIFRSQNVLTALLGGENYMKLVSEAMTRKK